MLLLFGKYGTLKLDHMGLEIAKLYSPYSFHPITGKLYEGIGYRDGSGRGSGLNSDFEPLKVKSPSANWFRWCIQVNAGELDLF